MLLKKRLWAAVAVLGVRRSRQVSGRTALGAPMIAKLRLVLRRLWSGAVLGGLREPLTLGPGSSSGRTSRRILLRTHG